MLAETCAPLPLVVKGLVRGDDARAALGLGARAVFVGRPVLWGLGAAGEASVARVLALFDEELARSIQLAGCAEASKILADLVRPSRLPP